MRALTMLGLALLAGCATTTTGGMGPGDELSAISYRTQPCYGTCPVYEVRVDQAGAGVFTGVAHTAVTGERRFTVTPDQFAAFAATLAPARPSRDRRLEMGGKDCGMAPTDMPSIQVEWRGAETRTLDAYLGCRVGNEPLFAALEAAPRQLPIASFIGAR